MLTIISSVLLIISQGYWLDLQYNLAKDSFIKRKEQQFVDVAEIYFTKALSKPSKINCVVVIKYGDSLKSKNVTTSVQKASIKKGVVVLEKGAIIRMDTFCIRKIISQRDINILANRYIVSIKSNNTLKSFEQDIRKLCRDNSISVSSSQDSSFIWYTKMLHESRLFSNQIHFYYGYNPLKKKNILVTIKYEHSLIFRSMVWQFISCILLSALLIFCLIYQIQTIVLQQHIEKIRKDFSHAMIHELRRPVQSLKMLISFLSSENFVVNKEMSAMVIQNSRKELDNLSAYFSKLRDMTYGDMEEIPLNVTAFDLKEAVIHAISLLNKPNDRDINIYTSFDQGEMLIYADRIHISNILCNLLENSIKYSNGNTEISISAHLEPGFFIIEVKDNGIGISEVDQKYIFGKFYRSKNISSTNIPGIGLGLSYVQQLVQAHKGRVEVVSTLGKGSLFTIRIPNLRWKI